MSPPGSDLTVAQVERQMHRFKGCPKSAAGFLDKRHPCFLLFGLARPQQSALSTIVVCQADVGHSKGGAVLSLQKSD